jgi:hypothetical protein
MVERAALRRRYAKLLCSLDRDVLTGCLDFVSLNKYHRHWHANFFDLSLLRIVFKGNASGSC